LGSPENAACSFALSRARGEEAQLLGILAQRKAAVIAQEPQTAQWLLQQALPRLEVEALEKVKNHEPS